MTAQRITIVAVLILIFAQPALAGVQVTFQVNMRHVPLQRGDEVALRTSAEALGGWDEGIPLHVKEGTSSIYAASLAVPDSPLGDAIYYKFVIVRRNGTVQWEERSNRILAIPGSDTTLKPVFFNDRSTPPLNEAAVAHFSLDMRARSGEPLEAIAILGSRAPLSWSADLPKRKDLMLMHDRDGDRVWEVSLTFPVGTPQDLSFKFAFRSEGLWRWESLPGTTDHALWLPEEGGNETYHMVFDRASFNIKASEGSAGHIDDYGYLLEQLGDVGRRSRFPYYLAIQQLKSRQIQEAQESYGLFKEYHPGEDHVDDFHYLHARLLAQDGRLDAALALLRIPHDLEH